MANIASSAARAASGCLSVTPRITFQPLLSANVFSRVRSSGVSVATAQDGCFSPLEVQNVVSTKFPPNRMTPGPSVFMYWYRLPADGAVPVSTLASNEKPTKLLPRPTPVLEPTDTDRDAAGVAAWAATLAVATRATVRAIGARWRLRMRSPRGRAALSSDV